MCWCTFEFEPHSTAAHDTVHSLLFGAREPIAPLGGHQSQRLHASYMHLTCILQPFYKHFTGILHAFYMHFTAILHAFYIHVTCILQPMCWRNIISVSNTRFNIIPAAPNSMTGWLINYAPLHCHHHISLTNAACKRVGWLSHGSNDLRGALSPCRYVAMSLVAMSLCRLSLCRYVVMSLDRAAMSVTS